MGSNYVTTSCTDRIIQCLSQCYDSNLFPKCHCSDYVATYLQGSHSTSTKILIKVAKRQYLTEKVQKSVRDMVQNALHHIKSSKVI